MTTGAKDFVGAGGTREAGHRAVEVHGPAVVIAGKAETARSLDGVTAVYRKWLYMPDDSALLATLGTVAANRMEGDPVWTLIVGPSGVGKTETIEGIGGLPGVHASATLTEGALLSGSPNRDKAKDARGGLLRVIGESGIILFKDFGSILSMQRDARAATLAALREVYDGSWTRHVGTDGGRTLTWTGRVGFVGGCTPMIDKAHAVMSSLGERFLLLRLPESVDVEHGRRAVRNAGHEVAMRRELRQSVADLFARIELPEAPPDLTGAEMEGLLNIALLVCRARSPVERDGYSRDIELVPGAESPTRLAKSLKRLLDGLTATGVIRPRAWSIVRRVALDSMPALRLAVLRVVSEARPGDIDTLDAATRLGYPTTTTRRANEDLAVYGLLVRSSGGKRNTDLWRLSPLAERLIGTVPEMSEPRGGAGL